MSEASEDASCLGHKVKIFDRVLVIPDGFELRGNQFGYHLFEETASINDYLDFERQFSTILISEFSDVADDRYPPSITEIEHSLVGLRVYRYSVLFDGQAIEQLRISDEQTIVSLTGPIMESWESLFDCNQ